MLDEPQCLLGGYNTVGDPGLPGGGGASSKDEDANLLFWPIFPKNYMKMKIVDRGRHL